MKKTLTRIIAAVLVVCLLAGVAGVVDAGVRIGTRRALLGVGEEIIGYLLRAAFSVGDVALNAGDVNTQAPGSVEDGTLTAVETDGTLAIVSNKLAFTAQVTPSYNDLGVYSQGLTKTLGKTLISIINKGAGGIISFQLDTSATVRSPINTPAFYNMYVSGAAVNSWRGALPTAIATMSGSTDHNFAVVMGGYDSNKTPWYSGQVAASYLYGVALYIEGGAYSTWTLLWKDAGNNTSPLYAVFLNYSAVGTVDNFRVPDADLSAVLKPNNLSTFGSAGELSAYSPDVGGVWAEDIGDWDTDGTSLVATTLGIGSFTGLADAVYDAKITMPGAGTTAGGLVMRAADFTGASEDYWYAKVTPGTAGTDWEIIEYVNGAATQRASGDVDWTASTAYAVRCILDTQEISCFADGGDKITYSSATTGQTATTFGLRDEGNSNMTFDNVALFARTSGVYDSTLDID